MVRMPREHTIIIPDRAYVLYHLNQENPIYNEYSRRLMNQNIMDYEKIHKNIMVKSIRLKQFFTQDGDYIDESDAILIGYVSIDNATLQEVSFNPDAQTWYIQHENPF